MVPGPANVLSHEHVHVRSRRLCAVWTHSGTSGAGRNFFGQGHRRQRGSSGVHWAIDSIIITGFFSSYTSASPRHLGDFVPIFPWVSRALLCRVPSAAPKGFLLITRTRAPRVRSIAAPTCPHLSQSHR